MKTMPHKIRTELDQEIVNALIDTKAVNFDAIGGIIAKFGDRATRSGTNLSVVINKYNLLACGWPGPELRQVQVQPFNESAV